jgi:hypothetical protein
MATAGNPGTWTGLVWSLFRLSPESSELVAGYASQACPSIT